VTRGPVSAEVGSPAHLSVQGLVDALSVALQRPVLVDDDALVPIAYSPHSGELDAVRSESILRRRASWQVREALLAQRIATASDVVRTRRVDELDMGERVCAPIRRSGRLLGYIWVLDPAGALGDRGLAQLRDAAACVGALLSESAERLVPDESALLAQLISPDATARSTAAEEVRVRALLSDTSVVLCLLAGRDASVDAGELGREIARRLSARCSLAGAGPDGAAIVVAGLGDPVLRTLHDDDVARWMHLVARSDIAVGQSARAALDRLDVAARQAHIALRVARTRPADGSFAAWSQLGADRVIAQLPPEAARDLPPALMRLLREDQTLASTLCAFLDEAGDVKRTAARLSLHRSGLYYRLSRIEQLTGLKLDRGDDRLTAHLALRTHRLFERRPVEADWTSDESIQVKRP
jgi:hypothetical protein